MDVDDRRSPRAGSRLLVDRYRLVALLGRGGAGAVYEAVDVVLGRRVAVKLFEAADNPLGRYRFAAEARLLAGLSHPGLVRVYDVCLDGDQPFLVMELVDGPTLRDLMNRGPFEPAAVARIGVRLAEALAYVHANDVVHRDIKPANVLIDPSGACHLSDFGIARALSAAHLTVTGEYVGTAAYLAPEQITDVDTGPAADIYALGLVLLECLTGQTEYTGSTVESALARLGRSPRVPQTLPDGWRGVLSAMTAQDPDARPDAARCAELLAAVAAGHPGPARSGSTTPGAQLPIVPAVAPSKTGRLDRGRVRGGRRAVHAGAAALALAAVAVTAATIIPEGPSGQLSPFRVPRTTQAEPVVESVPSTPSASSGGPATPPPNTQGGSPPPAQATTQPQVAQPQVTTQPGPAPEPGSDKKPDKPKNEGDKPPPKSRGKS